MGEIRIEAGFVDVLEERGERVEIFLGDRVELVVVTTAALEREPEESRAEGGDAVVDVVDAVFLFDRAALGFLCVETVEGGGEDLIFGGLGQEVAGELVGDEFIPREVLVEGLNDPVAPWPHVALAVDLETVAVGVAGEVEPICGHAFAIARRGE